MNEWLGPGLLQVYKQERAVSSDATLPNISFLLASTSLQKALTPTNYAYISADCVNLWLPASDYYSSSYKIRIVERGLYFPFDIYQNTLQTPEKRKT